MKRSNKFRVERDSMGEMNVPATALYGASTQRAVINFPVSDLRLPRSFIRALASIKLCAAQANHELGLLEKRKSTAIERAANAVANGRHDAQFVVDVFQTGSGTSTNMNANEVIATLARRKLSGDPSARELVHPNDHVNMGQSSNDVIPSATHIAALLELHHSLLPALEALKRSLQKKSKQFESVIKTGRTHLQDATPITLGQEFLGYVGQVERALDRIHCVRKRLCFIALGGTAVGTGINTDVRFASLVCEKLSKLLGFAVKETDNHFQAQSTLDDVVDASGALRTTAVSLTKIANDIRWLASGPRAGFGEITLPAVQPGSSIMPGKVNPVIAESLLQVAAQVIGNDATIALAGQSGNFELNVMQPVAAFNLLQSIALLAAAVENFRVRCIDGIESTQRGPESVEKGLALVTALVPAIGYDAAAAIAHEASETGESVFDVSKRKTNLSEEQLRELLDPSKMLGA